MSLILEAPIQEINKLYARLDRAYDNLFGYYCTLKTDTDLGARHILDNYRMLKETPPEALMFPVYMREFLGNGIISSYKYGSDRPLPGKSESSFRVGRVLSVMHNEIKDKGRKWDLFDVSRLDEGFQAILTNLVNETRLERWEIMDDDSILEDVINRFAKLKEVPIKEGRALPNKAMRIAETRYTPKGPVEEYSEVPLAAIVWCVHYAGIKLQSRSLDSLMRRFLVNTFGIGEDAGNKMSFLHEASPELFPNYNREIMQKVIADEAHWLLVTDKVRALLGHEDSIFADLVHAADVKPHRPPGSAFEMAVLLHGLREAVTYAVPFDAGHNQALISLGATLAEIGRETEINLDKMKIEDGPQAGFPDAHLKIMREQEAHLRATLQESDAQPHLDALTALKSVVTDNVRIGKIPDVATEVANLVTDFYQRHLPISQQLDKQTGINS